MTKWYVCVAGFFSVIASAAHAASFDCAKSQRPVEKLICSNPKLNLADERLGLAYRTGLQKLTPAGIGPLRADQVQWLAWMQEVCHAPQPNPTSPAAKPDASATDIAACMLPLYDKRSKQLRGIVIERDGMRFLMRTQYLAAPESEPAAMGRPEYPGFGTLQVSWPFALLDSAEWAAWNGAAEAAAYSMVGDAEAASKGSFAKKVPWTPDLAGEADTEITVHVMRVEHGRVTSAVAMNTMGHGAAHPSEASATMTWLLQAKRPMRAEDVFVAGDAWKTPVAQACWNAIHTGDKKSYVYDEVTGPDTKALQTVIADIKNWTLEHDGLHISYPEYAVTPRYVGTDDTVIPWATLQPVLAKGFVAP